MKRNLGILIFLGAVSFASLPAQADCRAPPTSGGSNAQQFHVDKNDTVTFSRLLSGTPSECKHAFTAGANLTFTSASILRTPLNGTLQQTGAFSFLYKPNPGFKGKDAYAVKVCGKNRVGSGCSTINYDAAVN
jgi:hypothetical protein